MLIAKYTTDVSGVVPTFDRNYQYTINETVSNGIYTVELNSDTDFTSCSFKSKSNLLTVEYLKVTNKVTNMAYMFQDCSQLTQLDASNWDTSSVTLMNTMFRDCSSLTQLDVSNWNTSKVTTMNSMFRGCSSLTQLDLSDWVTNKVQSMNYVFQNCSQLTQLNVSNLSTNSLLDNTDMFGSCSSLNDVIATNVSTSTLSKLITLLPTRTSDSYGTIKVANTTDKVTSSANAKYWNIKAPTLIARYTTSASGIVPTFNDGYQYTVNETETNGIYAVELFSYDDFTSCSFNNKSDLLTVEYLKVTDKVTNMYNMFYFCTNLTQLDVSNWDTSNVTNMGSMFNNCSQLTQLDLSNWNTSNVINIGYMFYYCHKLTLLDVSNWDTSKVSIMYDVFYNCSALVNIGMIYCNLKTINTLSSLLPTTKAKQVYIQDVKSFECTEVSNITFIDYISDSNVITLPVTLVSGDEILWDDSSQRYIIKRSDGTTIQTDITSKFKIDLYTPYTMIYTDNVTSISVNIFRKEI